MNKNKTLFPLLQTLGEDEWTLWKAFCLSKCARSQIDIAFIDLLYKHKANLNEVTTATKLQKKFTDQNQLAKSMTRLFKISEDFLIDNYYRINQNERQLLLNRIYNKNGLYTHANKCFLTFKKTTQLDNHITFESQELRYQFLKQQYYSDNPIKYDNSEDLFKSLIAEYKLINSLQAMIFYAESINWGVINKVDYLQEMEYLKILIQESDISVSLALNDLCLALKSLDQESYLKVVDWVKSDQIKDGSIIHTLLTMYLMRLSITLWKTNVVSDSNIVADSISYGLKHNVYSTNGKIPTLRFLNIINTLGTLKSYEWQDAFIEKWSGHVATNNLVSTKALAKALSAFISKKYDQILILLRGQEFDNYSEKSRAKKLELVALFEDRVNNYSNLRASILSFKRFLKRHRKEISTLEYKSSLNFAKLLDALMVRDFTRKTINLEKYQPLTFRSYMTEKVNKV